MLVGWVEEEDGSDFEVAKERKWPGTDFGEGDNVFLAVARELEISDLPDVGRKEGCCANRSAVIDDHVKCRSLCSLKEGRHVGLALFEEQLGPHWTMLKKSPTPMTTHRSGVETVLLGRQVDGDETEDLQRDAIDVNEGVFPLTNGCQRGRDVPVELRDRVRGESVGKSETRSTLVSPERHLPTYSGE